MEKVVLFFGVLVILFLINRSCREEGNISGSYCADIEIETKSKTEWYDGHMDVINDQVIFIYFDNREIDLRDHNIKLYHYDTEYRSTAYFEIRDSGYMIDVDWGHYYPDECHK